jgi:hypothetical protein
MRTGERKSVNIIEKECIQYVIEKESWLHFSLISLIEYNILFIEKECESYKSTAIKFYHLYFSLEFL